MIPEHYWRILRRWFWLIGAVAAVCVVFAVAVMPSFLGAASAGHSSAVTLGVTRVVSLSGTVSMGVGDQDLMSSYTENVAQRGNTPQFLRQLNTRLANEGLMLSDASLARKLDFTPVPGLGRIDIVAEAGLEADAQLMASTAAQLMVEEITAEETRIRDSLTLATTEQQAQLLERLNLVYADRNTRLAAIGEPALREALDNLIRSGVSADVNQSFNQLVQDLARVSGDPQLAVLNSEAESLERQLATLSDTQRAFSAEILRGDPVSIVDPVDTVQLPPATSLRTRDLGLMGVFAGLILGWVVASLADGWVISNRMERARREEWDTVSTTGIERFFSHD